MAMNARARQKQRLAQEAVRATRLLIEIYKMPESVTRLPQVVRRILATGLAQEFLLLESHEPNYRRAVELEVLADVRDACQQLNTLLEKHGIQASTTRMAENLAPTKCKTVDGRRILEALQDSLTIATKR